MYSESASPVPAAPSAFSLRPLSTGEVLDRSFALFRSSFLLCIGVSMVPAMFFVVQLATRMVYLKVTHLSARTGAWSTPGLIAMSVLFSIVSIFIFGWSSAALCWVTSRRYLNRAATVREAYTVVARHWLRYPVLLVLQALRAAWFTILLYAAGFGLLAYNLRHGSQLAPQILGGAILLFAGLSFFLATYLYIRLALAMPAAVMEELSPGAALRRSKALLTTRKGRVFGVLVVVGIFYLVLGSATGVVSFLFLRGRVELLVLQAVGLLVNFVSTLLLQPLFMTALCVVYYDERVRHEGYDLTFLMEQADSALVTQPATVPPAIAPGATAY